MTGWDGRRQLETGQEGREWWSAAGDGIARSGRWTGEDGPVWLLSLTERLRAAGILSLTDREASEEASLTWNDSQRTGDDPADRRDCGRPCTCLTGRPCDDLAKIGGGDGSTVLLAIMGRAQTVGGWRSRR